MEDIKIEESLIDLTNGRKGKIAVFFYTGEGDPVKALDHAISVYVGNERYTELIDINMDNPRFRVIMSGVNELKQENFDPLRHRLKA